MGTGVTLPLEISAPSFVLHGPLKQHLEGCRSHCEEAMEMAVCVQFLGQDPGFSRDGFLKSCKCESNTSEFMNIKLENNNT
jgi:hypothetical protein